MVQIQRPYLPEKGGIRFRDKDLSVLQVSASKWHVVDGKKKQVRTTATVRLEPFSDQKTFQIAFDKALEEAKGKKRTLDVGVSTKGVATMGNTAKIAKVGTFGVAVDGVWDGKYAKQSQIKNAKILVADVVNYFPRDKKLNSFTFAEIEAFKEHMFKLIESRAGGKGTVANSSVNKRCGVIRETWRYALKHRMMSNDDLPNPDPRKKDMGCEDLPRAQASIKPILDVQQESQLIQQAIDNDDLDYSEILGWQFDTGMRWDGEVNLFQYKDIDFKTQSITFQRRKTGNNWSVIPLTSRSILIAKRRSKFALANGGRLWNYTRSQLRHKWDLTRRMAGLDKKYSSYCTRHTCCTRLVESGLPANVIKDWMGHKSIITSMTYYAKSSPKLMNKAVNALEGYNQECRKLMEDKAKEKASMIGHNSKNRLK